MRTNKEHREHSMRQALTELKAREDEVGREWDWLQQAINTIARASADQGDAQAFRLMQQGQRRVELHMQRAQLETADVNEAPQ